jgi:hypothetical protein
MSVERPETWGKKVEGYVSFSSSNAGQRRGRVLDDCEKKDGTWMDGWTDRSEQWALRQNVGGLQCGG